MVNGNPLQCSCLENPRDRGAWWPAIYGVAQSRTRLKRLSSSSSSRASLIAQLVKNLPANRRPWFDSWVKKIRWRRDRLPTSVFLGFPCGSASKASSCNVEDLGSIPGLGRSPGEGKVYPLQYSGLESQTQLSNFHLFIKNF